MVNRALPNVWTQMNYVPPRGQCNFKQTVLSSRCPCLRFMLHPVQSSSSFECDGCAHHASFHNMENKAEDEIRKRWEQEARDKAEREQEAKEKAGREQERPKKRVRAIGYGNQDGEAEGAISAGVGKGRANVRRGRVSGRIGEIGGEGEAEIVEVD